MLSLNTVGRLILNGGLLGCLAVAIPPAAATAAGKTETVTWYDVEIIIFRQADPKTTETWPADTGAPDIAGIRHLFGPVAQGEENELSDEVLTAGLEDDQVLPPAAPDPYQPLPAEDFQLQGIYDSLTRSSRYEPLLHVAWTQPGVSQENAVPLRITLPGAFDQDGNVDETAAGSNDDTENDEATRFEQFPNRPAGLSGGSETNPATAEPGPALRPSLADENQHPDFKRPLDGQLLVYVKTYLHMNLDLLYLPEDINPEIIDGARPASNEYVESLQREREQRQRAIMEALARGDLSLEEAEIMSLEPEQKLFEGFRLEARRRMRSREIHYFDHPVYGVITTITPREIPLGMSGNQTGNRNR